MNAWILLIGAIGLEVLGTFFLKLSDGFEKWQWGTLSIICYGVCFWLLAPVMKVLPVGVVYAIWAGVGIAAGVLLSLVFFKETLGALQLFFISFIFIGAVGLQLTTQGTH